MSDQRGFFEFRTIYGAEGEHKQPYMTRLLIGRLRFHIFHRGDNDPDPHDHPWGFWTFPLTSYVEEVTELVDRYHSQGKLERVYEARRRVVRAFRIHYRRAEHTHRVLGRWTGKQSEFDNRKIVTLVWREKESRQWGFFKRREGKWCWQHWKDYIQRGGKHTPCE